MATVDFDGGPAEGFILNLTRLPLYLRIVVDEKTGKVDALDLLEDEPRPGERIYAYRMSAGPVFVCRGSDAGHFATYRHLPELDGLDEELSEAAGWQAKCAEHDGADEPEREDPT